MLLQVWIVVFQWLSARSRARRVQYSGVLGERRMDLVEYVIPHQHQHQNIGYRI